MKKAVEQDTLVALIESGAAREFRATRGPGGEGWSLSTRLGRFCETVGIRNLVVEF